MAKSKLDTQKTWVLNYLMTHDRLSSWEAIQKKHITRLPAIIWKLKRDGYTFGDETVSSTDSDGYHSHWKEYWLILDNGQEKAS